SLFIIRRHLTSTLFPYTTLFRSELAALSDASQRGSGRRVLRSVWPAPADHPLVPPVVAAAIDVGEAALGQRGGDPIGLIVAHFEDRKSTRLNSSHVKISYAVFCL